MGDNWIPIVHLQPASKDRVLVMFTNERGVTIITIAEYIQPKTVLADDYLSDEWSDGFAEYDEEEDCYWTPGGWYEWQYVPEVNFYLDEKITHWMPLPKAKP